MPSKHAAVGMCCVLVCVLVDSYLPLFGAQAASHSISGTHSNCDMFSHSRPVLDSCSNTLAVIGRVPGRTLYSAHQLEPPVMSIVSPIGVASLGSRYYVLAPPQPAGVQSTKAPAVARPSTSSVSSRLGTSGYVPRRIQDFTLTKLPRLRPPSP